SGWVTWEPLRGWQAAVRRGTASFDSTKPKFMLNRAELVKATVAPLESGYCHVTLTASLHSARRAQLVGSTVSALLGVGAAGAFAIPALGALSAVALVPVGVAALVSVVVLRKYRPIADRAQLGLERALDYLERGGVKPGHEYPSK